MLKDADQKGLFVGKKVGDIVTFNPQKAMNNAAEIASFLKKTKEEAEAITSDFAFEIKQITRYKEAAIDQTLFDKVFPNEGIADEATFRAKIGEGVKESYVNDSEYKFGLDAKEALVKKMDGLQFPEAFLKRWVLATNEKMTAEEKVKADYEDKITTLTEELGKKTKEIKDRKINEAILSNELPSYYKNDIRLINADDENFDKVIKDIKAEHNDYLKTLLQQNVKSTSPNIQKDSNNTSNETRDRVLAKVGIRTK